MTTSGSWTEAKGKFFFFFFSQRLFSFLFFFSFRTLSTPNSFHLLCSARKFIDNVQTDFIEKSIEHWDLVDLSNEELESFYEQRMKSLAEADQQNHAPVAESATNFGSRPSSKSSLHLPEMMEPRTSQAIHAFIGRGKLRGTPLSERIRKKEEKGIMFIADRDLPVKSTEGEKAVTHLSMRGVIIKKCIIPSYDSNGMVRAHPPSVGTPRRSARSARSGDALLASGPGTEEEQWQIVGAPAPVIPVISTISSESIPRRKCAHIYISSTHRDVIIYLIFLFLFLFFSFLFFFPFFLRGQDHQGTLTLNFPCSPPPFFFFLIFFFNLLLSFFQMT
jgi:hypothetical protein